MIKKEVKSAVDTTQIVLNLKRGQAGKRFQLLCNRDAILKWKEDNKTKKPKDIVVDKAALDALLVSRTVFANAVKKEPAKKDDIVAAFETENEEEVLGVLLTRGELQHNESDRVASSHESVDILKDVAALVANKVFNPTPLAKDAKEKDQRYTAAEIEREIKNLKYQCKGKTVEQNASIVVRRLRESGFPIQRLQRKLKGNISASLEEAIEEAKGQALLISKEGDSITFLLDPDNLVAWEKKFGKFEAVGDVNPRKYVPSKPNEDLTLCEFVAPKKKAEEKEKPKASSSSKADAADDEEELLRKKKEKKGAAPKRDEEDHKKKGRGHKHDSDEEVEQRPSAPKHDKDAGEKKKGKHHAADSDEDEKPHDKKKGKQHVAESDEDEEEEKHGKGSHEAAKPAHNKAPAKPAPKPKAKAKHDEWSDDDGPKGRAGRKGGLDDDLLKLAKRAPSDDDDAPKNGKKKKK